MSAWRRPAEAPGAKKRTSPSGPELAGSALPKWKRHPPLGAAAAVGSVHTRVDHVRQCFKWDCGIACIMMVLRTRGVHKTRKELADMAGTSSVWTVDLAYIMRKCGLACTFHTVMEGVREDYAEESFYKDELDEDRVRVDGLFRGAKEAGVGIATARLTVGDIAAAVLQGRLAIVLTDRRLMRPGAGRAHSRLAAGGGAGGRGAAAVAAAAGRRADQKGATTREPSGDFTGHYVILCGYDSATSRFDVCDPACDCPRYTVATDQLDAARKAWGTDEDIIIMAGDDRGE